MTLVVHPDPQEPAGGFAFLELPDGSLQGDTTTVAVFDAYGERWLRQAVARNDRDLNWQTERFEFGPYRIYRHEGADWVRIGPEIVNWIEEYAPLRIAVGGAAYNVIWPDDVAPRARAAELGDIRPVARPRPVVATPAPAPRPASAPEPATDPAALTADTVPPPAPKPRARRAAGLGLLTSLLLFLFAVVAGAAAGTWWHWPADTASQSDTSAVVARAATDTCSVNALSGLGGGFATVGQAMRNCGRDITPDVALALVEDYAARSDPQALLLFGTLYDGTELDARVENLIGLSFATDDTKAVEYYHRAVAAGAIEADTRLAATCARLADADSTLAKGAYDDYCR